MMKENLSGAILNKASGRIHQVLGQALVLTFPNKYRKLKPGIWLRPLLNMIPLEVLSDHWLCFIPSLVMVTKAFDAKDPILC